jgi:putative addiction module component (TIGR02574 family)
MIDLYQEQVMTKEAIIEEIKKHSPEEQQEILEAIWEPGDNEYELSDEEKTLLDRRWKEMQEHPERNLTLEQLKERAHGTTTT